MSPANFAVPAEDRYFEDYLAGAVFECGRTPVTDAEIIEFARRYDPQDMHVLRVVPAGEFDDLGFADRGVAAFEDGAGEVILEIAVFGWCGKIGWGHRRPCD